MTVTFPHSAAECASAVPTGPIVIVEDQMVSNLVRAVLRKHGYSAVLAGEAEAATLLRSPGAAAALLITNVPASFLDFAKEVHLVYLSSQPDSHLEAAFRSCRVVLKPFEPHDLIEAVNELLARE